MKGLVGSTLIGTDQAVKHVLAGLSHIEAAETLISYRKQ